jgi:hypothetical protein
VWQTLKLQAGEELAIAVEDDNPVTGFAIQFRTRSGTIIGYAPRYLVHYLIQIIRQSLVAARIFRANLPPPGQRLMVLFEGCWPGGYEPMRGEEFQPLVETTDDQSIIDQGFAGAEIV